MAQQTPQFPLPGAPDKNGATISMSEPLPDDGITKGKNEAVELIRNKVSKLYKDEPDAAKELKEAEAPGKHSKHQLHLLELHNQDLSMEDIQVRWHEYYQGLPDDEKHEVWKEFYSNQTRAANNAAQTPAAAEPKKVKPKAIRTKASKAKKPSSITLKGLANSNKPKTKLGFKTHAKSIGFGLGIGLIVFFVYQFTFFNQQYILPFIQPNAIAASTPIITVPGAAVSDEPKVIIPKLNVEAPVVYDVPYLQPGEDPDEFEERTQDALENGVVHYPTSQRPGEAGQGFNSNTVIVGHSSNNLFNNGKYKFAFMQLNQLDPGDTFMINYNAKQYVYKIYEKKVIAPTELGVLGAASRPNSATLITCDPPGFNVNRLVIVAEQISPNPELNVLTTEEPTAVDPSELIVPGQPETLWQRFWGFFTG